MVGNHVDCRVLTRLVAEHLPQTAAQLKQLDASIQLVSTRWFLCLWSSVLPAAALLRLWDFLCTRRAPPLMPPCPTLEGRTIASADGPPPSEDAGRHLPGGHAYRAAVCT
eukprot:2635327-Prymnesium_polylepis.1